MKKVLVAVLVVAVIGSVAVPVQAGVGGKTKPPMELASGWWDQLVAAFLSE